MKEKVHRLKSYRRNYRFCNEKTGQQKGFLLHTICMLFGSSLHRICDAFKDSYAWVDKERPIDRSDKLAITWIGHSTFLIQVGNITILTDPVFGKASCFFPRILPAGIDFNELPPIDIIVLSHNHPDHMEEASLTALEKRDKPHILVPLGTKACFDCHKFTHVSELNWWDHYLSSGDTRSRPLKVTFLPAIHWSQHSILDKNKALWGSWMIECNGYTLYFAGDTIYSDHFISIAHEFPHIDVAFLPIGPCEPRCWLKYSHMNAHEAGRAFLDLNAKHFFPMHWGTFHFGVEPFDLSIRRLQNWQNENKSKLAQKKTIHFQKVGKRISIDD